jgi:hypothetical protein
LFWVTQIYICARTLHFTLKGSPGLLVNWPKKKYKLSLFFPSSKEGLIEQVHFFRRKGRKRIEPDDGKKSAIHSLPNSLIFFEIDGSPFFASMNLEFWSLARKYSLETGKRTQSPRREEMTLSPFHIDPQLQTMCQFFLFIWCEILKGLVCQIIK